jgi:hypothetical protein
MAIKSLEAAKVEVPEGQVNNTTRNDKGSWKYMWITIQEEK